ncbi:hypothetical protein [Streptomyces sp. NPDC057052]
MADAVAQSADRRRAAATDRRWDRSRAWICDFSSAESTTAPSGG